MEPNDQSTSTYVEGVAGPAALEAVKEKFTDTTVDESRIGFGDKFCDWRAPLAQVKIYKDAEDAAKKAEKFETEDGDMLTAEELKAAAMEMHNPTPGKVEMLERFYGEDEEEKPAENGDGDDTGNDDNDDETGDQTITDQTNP